MSLLATDRNGHTIQGIRPGRVQVVAVGAAAAATSLAVSDDVTIVRIVSTTNCHYIVTNAAAAATANDSYLHAGVVEFLSVGKGDKISFIQDTASGTAYVTEGA